MIGARYEIPFWRRTLHRLPSPVRSRLVRVRGLWEKPAPSSSVDFGDLRRTRPISTWGAERGGAIDRYYVAQFIERHAQDLKGHALEVGQDRYVRLFGRDVDHTDVVDVAADNRRATIVADLANAPEMADETFDCVVLTQVLPFVFDFRGVLRTVHRTLRSGGVLLLTTPGISRIAPAEAERFGHWWGFTPMSAGALCEEIFDPEHVEVESYGNVLVAASFLYGLGQHDLTRRELDFRDPAFPVTVGVRAVKHALAR